MKEVKEVSCINTTNIRKTFGEVPLDIYGQIFDYKTRGTKFGDVVIFKGNFYAVGMRAEILMKSKQLCLPDHLSDFLASEFEKETGGFLDFGLILDYEDYEMSAFGYHYTRSDFLIGGCAQMLENRIPNEDTEDTEQQ